MNGTDVIVNIKNMKDIETITKSTKYINISIDSVDLEVIDYFILNGSNYCYSDTISDRNGFIYTSYETFKLAESIIDNIVDAMNINLNELEIIRYIYISLGRILSSDINVISEKNETVSFDKIGTINNIWSAIFNGKVGEAITSKIFMYVCSRLGIKCELVSSSVKGNFANKVYFNDTFLIVDLYSDLHNIHGGFCTNYFDKYNDDKELDKKIGYIKDEYMDYYVSSVLANIDYTKDDTLYEILSLTNNVINVNNIGTCELFKIYRNIFDKYASNYDIKISNLFVNNGSNDKCHFALFSYEDMYYSFNYNIGSFVSIEERILCDNIKSKRIGVYCNEDFNIGEKRIVL